MSDFRVDLDALERLIDGLRAFEQHAATSTGDVDAQVKRLQCDWTGWAAEQHLLAHREWAAGAARMREAVSALRAAATTAHGNYTAAVGANARMWA